MLIPATKDAKLYYIILYYIISYYIILYYIVYIYIIIMYIYIYIYIYIIYIYILFIYIYIYIYHLKSGSELILAFLQEAPKDSSFSASGSNPWYCTPENIWQMDGPFPKNTGSFVVSTPLKNMKVSLMGLNHVKTNITRVHARYTLWLFNIAMENCPLIGDKHDDVGMKDDLVISVE